MKKHPHIKRKRLKFDKSMLYVAEHLRLLMMRRGDTEKAIAVDLVLRVVWQNMCVDPDTERRLPFYPFTRSNADTTKEPGNCRSLQ